MCLLYIIRLNDFGSIKVRSFYQFTNNKAGHCVCARLGFLGFSLSSSIKFTLLNHRKPADEYLFGSVEVDKISTLNKISGI